MLFSISYKVLACGERTQEGDVSGCAASRELEEKQEDSESLYKTKAAIKLQSIIRRKLSERIIKIKKLKGKVEELKEKDYLPDTIKEILNIKSQTKEVIDLIVRARKISLITRDKNEPNQKSIKLSYEKCLADYFKGHFFPQSTLKDVLEGDMADGSFRIDGEPTIKGKTINAIDGKSIRVEQRVNTQGPETAL